MRQETCGTIVEYDEDVTATEATKAEGGALGMRLVTVGERARIERRVQTRLAARQSMRLARPGKCSEQKSWNCRLAERGTSMCRILKAST